MQRAQSASPLDNEGRGLKLREVGRGNRVAGASPLDNEGRGLKPFGHDDRRHRQAASPLDNEGRGLKLASMDGLTMLGDSFAPRQRGAWIETGARWY